MLRKEINDILIYTTESVKDALKRLDKTAKKVLLVVDAEGTLLGTVTDGDIRRYILSGKGLDNNIHQLYNKTPIYIKREDYSADRAKKILIESKVGLIPILEKKGKVTDFITWDQLFSCDKKESPKVNKVIVPVVVVAGGKGSRLEPFTKIFPKPLIPIGDKPIIEIIIDEFRKQGVSEYYVMLNHKGEMIEAYLNTIEKDYKINYVKERKSLGTAGGLRLLERRIGDYFIVSNCDVLVKANFEDALNYHTEHEALLTILSSIQHYKIPYGVVNFKDGGEVVNIVEKPEYTININTGVYILSKECLHLIPKDSSFDMTDLIESLLTKNKKVVVYPINESDYIDIGQWEEYRKAVEKLQLLR